MIQLNGVVKESIVDGPGIRYVLFTQGCPHGCLGCHNPETHPFTGGYAAEAEEIFEEFSANPLLKGITFSGGEPMLQAAALLPLAKRVREEGRDVAIFTGYTYEELLEKGKKEAEILALLKLCTFLVDGRYVQAERDLTLAFRGSRNQRILHAAQSLEAGKPVAVEGYAPE